MEGGGNGVGAAEIKVPGGLGISKECRRWHKQTHRTIDIVNYRLNQPRGQFSEKR